MTQIATHILYKSNDGAEHEHVSYDYREYVDELIYDLQESGHEIIRIWEEDGEPDEEHDEAFYHDHGIHTIG